jgi:hypothetical protein
MTKAYISQTYYEGGVKKPTLYWDSHIISNLIKASKKSKASTFDSKSKIVILLFFLLICLSIFIFEIKQL